MIAWFMGLSPRTRKVVYIGLTVLAAVGVLFGAYTAGSWVGYANGVADCKEEQAKAIADALKNQQDQYAKDASKNAKDAQVREEAKVEVREVVKEVVRNVPVISCPDGSESHVPRDVVGSVLDISGRR